MTTYFLDTSAIGKRYVPEVGSAWVLSWILPSAGNVIVIAELTIVEMFSLLSRRLRENQLTAANTALLQSNFLIHTEKEYLIVPLATPILVEARNLVNKYPLRTLDAIQLACALQAETLLNETITFISADNNLLNAASAEGFKIDNPITHP